ncbi:MAG: hypothetical protein ACTHU0_21190 [Kofleriaceae bacterium]
MTFEFPQRATKIVNDSLVNPGILQGNDFTDPNPRIFDSVEVIKRDLVVAAQAMRGHERSLVDASIPIRAFG